MKTTISNFRYVDEDEMNDESFVSAATEDENVLGDPGENLLDDSVVPFSLLPDPDTSVAPSEPGTCTNRGKKRKSETEEEFEKACRAIQEANKRNNDPNEMTLYFLSIAKRVKKLPVSDQRKIRFDFETMLYEIEMMLDDTN